MTHKIHGFTLLEILLVILLLAVVGTLGVGRIGNSYRMERRALTWRMASIVKYLYNTAATENKTIRLVFDFEDGSYWAEETTDRFILKMADKEDERKKVEEEQKAKKEKDVALSEEVALKEDSNDLEEPEEIAPFEASFGAMENRLVGLKKLPSKIFLKDIHTGHNEGPVTDGKAYIYFFPSGYAEAAVVNFRDEDDARHISVKINPFNGDVDISEEYRTIEGKK